MDSVAARPSRRPVGALLAGVVAMLACLAAPGPATADDVPRGADRQDPRRAGTTPTTRFHMPFPCGQEWTGTTRSGHSPSTNSVDWNRPDDEGDQVVASAAGTVQTSVKDGTTGYGRWVRVSHENGESTVYAHLSSVSVSVGQVVDQGALLGLLGSTGNSTGPHLHFEERSGSTVIHPWFGGQRFEFGSTWASTNCVDVPVAGNFVGDAAAEVGVFRRSDAGTFVVHRPQRKPKRITFGAGTDQPVVGDWDGDGRVDPGVRTPVTKTFTLSTPAGPVSVVFGKRADLPVAGDWDGDGLWEVGVRRAKAAAFRLRAADGSVTVVPFGDTDDLPVTGDWDGDGRTDLGVYDQDAARFTLRLVDEDGLEWQASVAHGEPGDLPVTGDWDANGRTDVGVWHPATGTFEQRRAPSPTAARASTVQLRFGRPR